jgi:alkanesulfonate monooxygenase SsuD/methylene tetrahydromethanopterin reductase-like flavin-dependent oxidoreductase (luciferase family)
MLPVGYLPCSQDPPAGRNMAGVIDEIVAEAQMAEASGFDGCFITEHHQQPDGYIPNPLLMAGLIGVKTKRIRVGTCVLLLPLHHPIQVAEDCAIVDLATRGRLTLSVGVGYQAADFDAFGVAQSERGSRIDEGVEILRRAFSGERFSFDGKHFKLKSVTVSPAPYQAGGPPIWIAAWTQAGLRRAGRLADGWIADPIQSLQIVKDFAARYREAAIKASRKPFVCLMRDAVIASNMREAEQASGPTMVTHRFYFENGAYVPDKYIEGIKTAAQLDFATITKDRLLVGSPTDCLEQLQMWKQEIKPDYLIVRFRQPGGPPHQRALEMIRQFGDAVIPKL